LSWYKGAKLRARVYFQKHVSNESDGGFTELGLWAINTCKFHLTRIRLRFCLLILIDIWSNRWRAPPSYVGLAARRRKNSSAEMPTRSFTTRTYFHCLPLFLMGGTN